MRVFEGFLSTEDSNAPGNNALLDLVAALHWVKENVEAFGGDPDRVTLMGQGHGAALVNILMISPVAKGQTARAAALRPNSISRSIGSRFLVDLLWISTVVDLL